MAVIKYVPAFVLFDLDGTLVDSLRDIGDSLNECLELLGVPGFPIERYRYMVGEGVPTLCRRAIGATHPHLVDRLIELSRARYRARPMLHTRPYDGVPELVARLRNAGALLGVLSNKPHEMTVNMVQSFWRDGEFAAIRGYIEEDRRKPDPTYSLELARTIGVPPAQTWLIGDTPTDVETARNAGMRCVAVTWGFRTREDLVGAGAELVVDRPDQVY